MHSLKTYSARRVHMKVSEIMSNRVVTVSPDETYKQLWSTCIHHHINAIPVIDDKKKLLGIVSKEDLLKTLYPNYLDLIDDFTVASDFEEMEDKAKDLSGITAKQIMNTHVIFTRIDTPIMRALSRMIAQHVDQLPVLTEDNKVVGIITKGDVFKGIFANKIKPIKLRKASKAFISA
jgi:CBS-domain-containing membrane protein